MKKIIFINTLLLLVAACSFGQGIKISALPSVTGVPIDSALIPATLNGTTVKITAKQITGGNIAPTTVVATGAITGSNLTGTNTGDQDLSGLKTKTSAQNDSIALANKMRADSIAAANVSSTKVNKSDSLIYTSRTKALLDSLAAVNATALKANLSAVITNIYRRGDSVFYTKNSSEVFAFTDSLGSGGGGSTWGSITGTLASQTDLQSALNLKVPTSKYSTDSAANIAAIAAKVAYTKYQTDSATNAIALAGKVSLTKYQTDSIANVANLATKVAYSKYQADSTAQAAINVNKVNKADSSNVGLGGYATPTQLNAKVTVVSLTKNATRDSIILLLSDGSRLAVKDSVGAGGGGADLGGNGTYTSNQSNTMNGFSQSFVGGQLKTDTIRSNITLAPVKKWVIGFGTSIMSGFTVLNFNGTVDSSKIWMQLFCNGLGQTMINKGIPSLSIQKRTPATSGGNMIDNVNSFLPAYNSSVDTLLLLEGNANDVIAESQGNTNYSSAHMTADLTTIVDTALARGWPANRIIIIPDSYISANKTIQDSLFTAMQGVATSLGTKFIGGVYPTSFYLRNQWFQDGSIHPGIGGHSTWAQIMLNAYGNTVLKGNQRIAINDTANFNHIVFTGADTADVDGSTIVMCDAGNHLTKAGNERYIKNYPGSGVRENGSIYLNGSTINTNGNMVSRELIANGNRISDSVNVLKTEIYNDGTVAYIQAINDSTNAKANLTIQPLGGNVGITTPANSIFPVKTLGLWTSGIFAATGSYLGTNTAGNGFYAYMSGGNLFMGSHNGDGSTFGSKGADAIMNYSGERLSIGNNVTPTAIFHISKAGTATAGTSPFKLTAGVVKQTTTEQGAINFDSIRLYIGIGSGSNLSNQTVSYLSDIGPLGVASPTLTNPLTVNTNSGQLYINGLSLKTDSLNSAGANNFGDTLQIVRGKHILCYGVSIEAGSGASQLAFSWPYLLAQTMGIPVRDSAVSGSLFQGTMGDGSFVGKYNLIPMYDTSIAFIIIGNYTVNECLNAAPQEATYYTTFGSYMDSLVINKHYPKSKIVVYNGSPTGASTRPQSVLSRMADSTYNISIRKGLTAINSFRFCQQFPLSQFVSTDSVHPTDSGHVDLTLCYFVGSLFGAKAGSISSNEITSAHNVTIGGTLNLINKIGLNMYGTIDWGNINSVLYDRVSFLDDKVTPRYAGIGYNTSTGNLGMTASGINMYFSNAANTKGVNLTTANSAFGVDGANALHTFTNFNLGSTITLPAINQNMIGYISFGASSGDYFRVVDAGSTGTRAGMGYNSPTGAVTLIGRGTSPSIMVGHNTTSSAMTAANSDTYWNNLGDFIDNKSMTITDSIVCGKLRAGSILDSIVTQSANGAALHKIASSLFAPSTSPTFTGIPTAPTASTGTSTTQIATTAFVQAAIAAIPAKPIIVSSAYIAAQTTAQTITTYTTGAADSSFIVSAYTNITAVTSDVIQTQYTYTDAESNLLRTVVFNNFSNTGTVSVGLAATGPSNYSVSGEIRVKASTTITVATVLTTGIGTITYSSSATITKLHN